jgi:asparagine synthase (glutamine-hydrolysing)
MLLSERVHSRGVKVCLTGEGADEIFAGYPYFRLEALWRNELAGIGGKRDRAKLWSHFRRSERRSEGYLWIDTNAWRNQEQCPPGGPSYFQLRAQQAAPWSTRFYRRWDAGIANVPPLETLFAEEFNVEEIRGLDPLNRTKRMTLNFLSQLIIPTLGDRVEMANSLECRTPFLDPNVTDLAAGLPPEFLVDTKTLREKHVLREAFHDLVPPEFRTSRKHPFLAPSWKTFGKQKLGREIFREYLSAERI